MKPYYDHAGIQIFHGDCREILPQLSGVDAVITDPPYGIGFVKGSSGRQGAYRGGPASASRGVDRVIGDDGPFDPSHLLRFGNVLMWGANHFCHRVPEGVGRWLAWNKLADLESFDSFSDVEFAWHSRGKASRIFNFMWKGGLACVKAGESNGLRVHPTQKPLGLMGWCIEQAGNPANILDPYCGSGSTLIAAKKRNLSAIGIEIEEKYCEIAAKRLSQEVFQFT